MDTCICMDESLCWVPNNHNIVNQLYSNTKKNFFKQKTSKQNNNKKETSHRAMKRYAAAAKSLQSCLTLCDPSDGNPPGFPVPGILQARILEWAAISFFNAGKWKVKVKSLAQSCPTHSDPMDCSPPGSSVHGIFQTRVLEWVAIAFYWEDMAES